MGWELGFLSDAFLHQTFEICGIRGPRIGTRATLELFEIWIQNHQDSREPIPDAFFASDVGFPQNLDGQRRDHTCCGRDRLRILPRPFPSRIMPPDSRDQRKWKSRSAGHGGFSPLRQGDVPFPGEEKIESLITVAAEPIMLYLGLAPMAFNDPDDSAVPEIAELPAA